MPIFYNCFSLPLSGKNKYPLYNLTPNLRRNSVRDMIRSDIPDRVAMMISGYKTRLIFKRYNTIDDTDLKLVAQRQAPD